MINVGKNCYCFTEIPEAKTSISDISKVYKVRQVLNYCC